MGFHMPKVPLTAEVRYAAKTLVTIVSDGGELGFDGVEIGIWRVRYGVR